MAKQAKQKQRALEWLIQAKKGGLYGETMRPVVSRLESYLTEYKHIFRSKTKHFFDTAKTYCRGIFISELCNIERISEKMSSDYYRMQHFITESPWNHRAVIDKAALDVSDSLPKRKLTGFNH